MQNRMKTALITGASDGIGEQAARILAGKGWQVAIIGRNPEKTRKVAQGLGALYYIADFSRLSEVRTLANQLLRDFAHIDLLANNAGGIFSKQPLTKDGHEITFQVNHLAHFLLTQLLLERLTVSKAMVINTSSAAHRAPGLDFDLADVVRPKRYSQFRAYGNAKLANILFTRELHRRYGSQGLSAAAFHPGIVATSFAKNIRSPMRLAYHTVLSKLLGMKSPEEGAATLVWLAEGQPGKDWQPGGYYVGCRAADPSKTAQDEELAGKLWDMSAMLCREPQESEQADG